VKKLGDASPVVVNSDFKLLNILDKLLNNKHLPCLYYKNSTTTSDITELTV
jgi:hypothetical protein